MHRFFTIYEWVELPYWKIYNPIEYNTLFYTYSNITFYIEFAL